MERQRNPTAETMEAAEKLLHSFLWEYFTERAASFKEAFENGKYQGAAYIKDDADAVFVFAAKYGFITPADAETYHGTEGVPGLFDGHKEAVCRARVDGELIQDTVMERFENLLSRLRSTIRTSLPQKTAETVLMILRDELEKTQKACERRYRNG